VESAKIAVDSKLGASVFEIIDHRPFGAIVNVLEQSEAFFTVNPAGNCFKVTEG
jgi:hypothetical protein